MNVLIADDDQISCSLLESLLAKWGYKVTVARDGSEAWEILLQEDCPPLAILDWMMPGLSGIELCQRARKLERPRPLYILMLTVRDRKDDLIRGLESGADDYLSKPFELDELRVRLKVGCRTIELQSSLANRLYELQEAHAHIKVLQGILPICMHCHKIRTDDDSWDRLEQYIREHSEAQLSHGICPDCLHNYYPQAEQSA